MSNEDTRLPDLHSALLDNLLRCIKDGTATAADKAVARALLRDSNIQCHPKANPNMKELVESLPFEIEGTS